jgi:hypothetical protein
MHMTGYRWKGKDHDPCTVGRFSSGTGFDVPKKKRPLLVSTTSCKKSPYYAFVPFVFYKENALRSDIYGIRVVSRLVLFDLFGSQAGWVSSGPSVPVALEKKPPPCGGWGGRVSPLSPKSRCTPLLRI